MAKKTVVRSMRILMRALFVTVGGQGIGLVLAVPGPEVPAPPLQQVGVADLGQDPASELVIRKQFQPVQDSVLLGGVG